MRRPEVLIVLVFAGCKAPPTDTGSTSPCADRTGGGEVEITVVDETFRFWTTDDAFLDHALELDGTQQSQVANFLGLVDGTDCDEQWTFHVDPAQMEWADFAIEVCDGRPSDVEGDKAYWIDQLGQWCPWDTLVTAVDDRR